ncbi:hypothetical protein BED41_07890 [Cloacibacillus porcorum]|uniref:Uncharacterized protein n=1 Tax=Cloacibacillus porcorum TaxID=1197717 RepID=A0A1B2I4U5_9BACT|nr:hypothetical protein BED41_07890 [Cloacibacillus porcorum]
MSSRGFCRGSVCRGNRAIQSNTPSVSRQKQAADTSLREGGCKKKSPFIIDRAEAKSLFMF